MNFLARKKRVISVSIPCKSALAAIGEQVRDLPVRKSWRDIFNPLIRNEYLQGTDGFKIRQRINTGRNTIDIAAVGTCFITGAGSCKIVVHYDIYPKWLRWFFWAFLGIALIISLTIVPAVITSGVTADNFFALLIPGFSTGITLLINAIYQSKLDRMHRMILKALRECERVADK